MTLPLQWPQILMYMSYLVYSCLRISAHKNNGGPIAEPQLLIYFYCFTDVLQDNYREY